MTMEIMMKKYAGNALQAMGGIDSRTARQVAEMVIRSHSERSRTPMSGADIAGLAGAIISERENAGADYRL